MDYHALQQKLFELDPTDPREDLAKLQAQANGGGADVAPTKDYIAESVEVPQGSMPLGLDSISDFAALAGVRLDEKQQMGSAGQAKGKDPMPSTSTPNMRSGEQPHPLKDKLVGEEDDPFIQAVDDTFGQGSVAKTIGFSPRGELTKLIYRAIKAVMPDATDQEIKKAADAAATSMQESISERELTRGEEKEKERLVKGMKKNKSDFKARYGDDAEAVMYATATKNAKNESSIADYLYQALTDKGL